MPQILISVPESESRQLWSAPTPTPTPGSLPRFRATPTPAPTPTPQPWHATFFICVRVLRCILFAVYVSLSWLFNFMYPLKKDPALKYTLDFFTFSSSMSNRLFFIILTIILIMLSTTFHFINTYRYSHFLFRVFWCFVITKMSFFRGQNYGPSKETLLLLLSDCRHFNRGTFPEDQDFTWISGCRYFRKQCSVFRSGRLYSEWTSVKYCWRRTGLPRLQ